MQMYTSTLYMWMVTRHLYFFFNLYFFNGFIQYGANRTKNLELSAFLYFSPIFNL